MDNETIKEALSIMILLVIPISGKLCLKLDVK